MLRAFIAHGISTWLLILERHSDVYTKFVVKDNSEYDCRIGYIWHNKEKAAEQNCA